MPDEELTLILRLRDEATKQMKSARAGIVAAGAAIAAAGFAAGKKWDDATKTIVAGTGATGAALKGLQADYQAVAKYGDGAATVIADLNTHLGLEGEELQFVAAQALKAGVNTNQFGDIAAQLGLDAKGSAEFLDQLVTASQESGVSVDQLTMTIGRSSARFQAAGGSVEDLTTLVVQQAQELGPTGLRGAMSEIMQEVDKGLIPTVGELSDVIGDSTDRVEQNYQAGKTWRDTLSEMKDGALAYLGPAGDMVGAIGSAVSGLALAGPQMLKWIKATKLATLAQKLFNLAMKLNPIGLIVTAITLVGLAIYKWRDQIFGFLKGAWNMLISGLETGYNFIARLVPGMEEVSFAAKMQLAPAVEVAAEALEDEAAAAAAAAAALAEEAAAAALAAAAAAELAVEIAAQLEVRRLQKRQFFHDALIARNEAKVDAIRIEQEEAAAVAVVLEARRLQKRQFIHDAVIARNEAKVAAIRIESEEAAAALAAGQESGNSFLGGLTSSLGGLNDIFMSAFEGGGQLLGAVKSFATQIIGNMLDAIVPGLGQFAGALVAAAGKLWGGIKKLWGGIKEFFGGPSEAELAGRELFDGFHRGAVEALGGTQRFADEVQVAINAGWDSTLAETRAGFILMGTDMGKTYDQAFADYERYQHAVKAGNTDLMAQIDAEYAEWRAASEETTEAVVHSAAEIGAQFKGLTVDEAAKLGDALLDLGRKANRGFTAIHDSALAAGNALSDRLLPQLYKVAKAISKMPSLPSGIVPGREHGGPVSAGSPYVVGEGGKPEIFVPGQSGSVVPNKSIPTAEEIGAAVAAAMQRVPLVVPQDAVTDSILRRTPNRQALRGWA